MIAAVGLLLGVLLGLLLQPTVPVWLDPYLPIAVVAALDAVFGALRAFLDDEAGAGRLRQPVSLPRRRGLSSAGNPRARVGDRRAGGRHAT